eukprot:GHVN01025522.1.p1 GENE.GHVN01025522.1~~GHVN01025522.1.p1  ORF type:complete len:120 (-),score=9.51 GHVN01025522.1:527-886(-)
MIPTQILRFVGTTRSLARPFFHLIPGGVERFSTLPSGVFQSSERKTEEPARTIEKPTVDKHWGEERRDACGAWRRNLGVVLVSSGCFLLFASRFAGVPTFFSTSEPDDKLECDKGEEGE